MMLFLRNILCTIVWNVLLYEKALNMMYIVFVNMLIIIVCLVLSGVCMYVFILSLKCHVCKECLTLFLI